MHARTYVISAVWLTLAACFSSGGSSDEGGGVSPSLRASSVDAAQAQRLCDELIPRLDQARDSGLCTTSALREAPDDATACRELARQCAEDRPPSDGDCAGFTLEGLSSCRDDVTVGQLRSCAGELIEWFEGADCERGPVAMPACVEALTVACPDSQMPPASQDFVVGTPCTYGETSTEDCPFTEQTMCGMAGGAVLRVCHPPGSVPTLMPATDPLGIGVWSACCCAQGGSLFCSP